MSDPENTVTIKQHLGEMIDLHMTYIRNDLDEIKSSNKQSFDELKTDIKSLQSHGCVKGAENKARLDALNMSSAKTGGVTGAIAGVLVIVINYFAQKMGVQP